MSAKSKPVKTKPIKEKRTPKKKRHFTIHGDGGQPAPSPVLSTRATASLVSAELVTVFLAQWAVGLSWMCVALVAALLTGPAIRPHARHARSFWPAWSVLCLFIALSLLGFLLVSPPSGPAWATALLVSAVIARTAETHSASHAASTLWVMNTVPLAVVLQVSTPITAVMAIIVLVIQQVAASVCAEQSPDETAWLSENNQYEERLLATGCTPPPASKVDPNKSCWNPQRWSIRVLARASENPAHALAGVLHTTLILLCLVPVAIAVFQGMPRLTHPLWSGWLHQGSLSGVGDTMNVAQWTRLSQDMHPAFRARFEKQPPPLLERYFRVHTFTLFDGRVWAPGPSDRRPAPPVNQDDAHKNQKHAPVWGSYTMSYLTPATARAPVLKGSRPKGKGWVVAEDGTARSARHRTIEGKSAAWQVVLPQTENTPKKLSAAQRRFLLELPGEQNPRTRQLAQSWRRQHPHDNQAIVDEALKFFAQKSFHYSLQPPPLSSRHPVDDFLFNTRTGFCVHFSSAFAVLMRAAGIPTRVVAGYAQGEATSDPNVLLFRQADAHAWDEVWIHGKWERADPTFQVSAPASVRSAAWTAWGGSHPVKNAWKSWHEWWKSWSAATQRAFDSAITSMPGYVASSLAVWGGVFGTLLLVLAGIWLPKTRRPMTRDRLTRLTTRTLARAARVPEAEASALTWKALESRVLSNACIHAKERKDKRKTRSGLSPNKEHGVGKQDPSREWETCVRSARQALMHIRLMIYAGDAEPAERPEKDIPLDRETAAEKETPFSGRPLKKNEVHKAKKWLKQLSTALSNLGKITPC